MEHGWNTDQRKQKPRSAPGEKVDRAAVTEREHSMTPAAIGIVAGETTF